MKAIWNGAVIAESNATEVVEGNHYFPADSVEDRFLSHSNEKTTCPWKGVASYYDVIVDGATNPGAAWYYPDPQPAAKQIKDRIAFWKGVEIQP